MTERTSLSEFRRELVFDALRNLQRLDVPLRVLAPILADVDPTRCGNCGRTLATDADWNAGTIEEDDRPDLCWGTGANCEADWEEAL